MGLAVQQVKENTRSLQITAPPTVTVDLVAVDHIPTITVLAPRDLPVSIEEHWGRVIVHIGNNSIDAISSDYIPIPAGQSPRVIFPTSVEVFFTDSNTRYTTKGNVRFTPPEKEQQIDTATRLLSKGFLDLPAFRDLAE